MLSPTIPPHTHAHIHPHHITLPLPPPAPTRTPPIYRYMAAPTEFGKQRNRAEADAMGVAFAELGPEAYAKWEFEKGFWNSGDDLEGDVRARWKERPTVHAGNVDESVDASTSKIPE